MRKNCLGRFLALMLALCCALPMLSAAAASYPMVGFTTDSLRLRKQPNENAAVLCTIPQGDAVLINGESGSYYVIIYEGNQGYGLKNYISANGAVSNQAPAPVIPPVQNPVVTTAYTLLTNGDRGEEVTILQEALKELGFYSGKADGQFGAGTKNALIAFQKVLQQAGGAVLHQSDHERSAEYRQQAGAGCGGGQFFRDNSFQLALGSNENHT